MPIVETPGRRQPPRPAPPETVTIQTPTTLAPKRPGRARGAPRWLPLVVSLGVHAVIGVVLVVTLVAAPEPPPQVAAFHAVTFVEPCREPACEEEALALPEEEPVDDLELHPIETPLAAPLEVEDLPALDASEVEDLPVLDAHAIPLDAVQPRRPAPETAPTPAPAPPVEPRAAPPRPSRARPVSRPPGRRAAPAAPLKLLSRPDLMRYYPEEARRQGIEGEALVEIVVGANGRVTGATLVRSSGSAMLDRQAIRVMYAYTFAPGAGGRARVPVRFRLR